MSHAVAAANNLGPQMMRLSSISSQDSGFTSQDTLFLRPGSPSNRSKVGDVARPRNLTRAKIFNHSFPNLSCRRFYCLCFNERSSTNKYVVNTVLLLH